MKFTNKMVLVPQDVLSSQSNTEKSPLQKQINEFKDEIKRILENESESPERQFQLYSQLFRRYLNLEAESREPQTVIFKPEEKSDEKPDFKFTWFDTILSSLPKSKIKQAQMLVSHIKRSKLIKVNDNGEISVDDRPIPNSHIVDLINDFSRERIKTEPPIGASEFAQALFKEHVPKEFIGNPNRRKMLAEKIYKKQSEKSDSVTEYDSATEGSAAETIKQETTPKIYKNIRKFRKLYRYSPLYDE